MGNLQQHEANNRNMSSVAPWGWHAVCVYLKICIRGLSVPPIG